MRKTRHQGRIAIDECVMGHIFFVRFLAVSQIRAAKMTDEGKYDLPPSEREYFTIQRLIANEKTPSYRA